MGRDKAFDTCAKWQRYLITYLGCDERYEKDLLKFFCTDITSFSLTHFKTFDSSFVNIMKLYLKNSK